VLRPRDDTDLLVDESSCDRAELLLLSLGYEPAVEHVMQLASGQRHFKSRRRAGVVHPLDMHWRVTNPLCSPTRCHSDASGTQRHEHSGARTLCDVDELLLACLLTSRTTETSELLWLMDIHLLATAITAEQWNEFTRDQAAACAVSVR
jgi:hypothetical protein